MRLYLLPLSTRRTLLYSQRLNVLTTDRQTILDRVTARAAKLWASWEERDSGWQRRVVDGGNALLKKIPYEEWALKTVPPLSKRRHMDELTGQGQGRGHIEVVFPESIMPQDKVGHVLKALAKEREAHHRHWLIWCFVGMPISAPFALVPIIPNLPFFYLVYRAWSHWRALAGGKHIKWLLDNKLVTPRPSPLLDQIYREGRLHDGAIRDDDVERERMLLSQEQGKKMARTLGIPPLETEIERAVWQVESKLQVKAKLDVHGKDNEQQNDAHDQAKGKEKDQ